MKEAIHIHTGKYYACKVINKKLMEGREYMVRRPLLTPSPPARAVSLPTRSCDHSPSRAGGDAHPR